MHAHRGRLPPLALATAAVAAAAVASPALAARKPIEVPAGTAVTKAISDCRKVADRDARLDCYDKAADAFDQAQAQGQVVVVDRDQVRAVKRQAFGISMPSLDIFPHATKEDNPDRIEVTLASAHPDATGKWVLTTTEDAVWRQIDTTSIYNDPHTGSKMKIRKAMLGSFFCNIDGQTAIRCTRAQ